MKLALAAPALAVALLLAACGSDPEATTNQSAAEESPCANLPSGPFTPERIGQPFNGSEDFAFDGQGHMVGKKGNAVIRVGTASADQTNLATLPGQTYGLRFHPNGNLIAAIPGSGKLVTITPNGQVSDLLTGLRGPNGVYVDFGGTIWWTEFNGSKVGRLTPDGTVSVMASGSATAQAADGVVLDATK